MWNTTFSLIFSALLCCSLVHGARTTSTNSSSSSPSGEDSSSSTIDGQLQVAPTTDVQDEIVETLNRQASGSGSDSGSESESQAPPPPADFKPSYLLSQYSSPDPSPVRTLSSNFNNKNKSNSALKPSPRILKQRQVSFSPSHYPGIVRKFDNEIKSPSSVSSKIGGKKTLSSSPSSASSSPSSSSVLKLFAGNHNLNDGEQQQPQGDREKHSTNDNTSTLLVHPILDSNIQEDEIHKNPTLYYEDLQRAPNSYLGGVGIGAARGEDHHQPHHSQHEPQHSEPHTLSQHHQREQHHHHHQQQHHEEHHHPNSLAQPKEPHPHHDSHEHPNMYYPKHLLASPHHSHGKHQSHHHPTGHGNGYENPNHGHGHNFPDAHHHHAHPHAPVEEHVPHHPHHHSQHQHHHAPHHPHGHHHGIGAHSDYRGHSHGHNPIGPVIGKALQILIPSALLLTGASALFPNRIHVPTNQKTTENNVRNKRSVDQYETHERQYAIPSAFLRPEHRAEDEGGVELFEGDYDEEHHDDDHEQHAQDQDQGTFGERNPDSRIPETTTPPNAKMNTNTNTNVNMKPTPKTGGSKKKNSFDIDSSDEPDFNAEVTQIEEDAEGEDNKHQLPEFKPMPTTFSKPVRVRVQVPVLRVKKIPTAFATTAAAAAAAVETQPKGQEMKDSHENPEHSEGNHDAFNFEDYVTSKEQMEPKKLEEHVGEETSASEETTSIPEEIEIESPPKKISQRYGMTQYPAYRRVAHKPIIIRTSEVSGAVVNPTRATNQNVPHRSTPQEAMSQILSVSIPTIPTSEPTKTTAASTTTTTMMMTTTGAGKKVAFNPTKLKTFPRRKIVKQPENDPYYEKPIFRRLSTDRPATVTVPTIKQINLFDDLNVDVDDNPRPTIFKKSKNQYSDSSYDKTVIRRGIAGTSSKSDDDLMKTMRFTANALEQTGNASSNALKKSLATIGKAAAILKGTGISKTNNQVEIDLSPDSPVVGLLTNYAGREKESPMCQKRALCELSLRGQSENATKFERFLWNLANLVPQSLSVYYDLEDTFDAVQKRKCQIFKCENPNLDLQEI